MIRLLMIETWDAVDHGSVEPVDEYIIRLMPELNELRELSSHVSPNYDCKPPLNVTTANGLVCQETTFFYDVRIMC